MKRPISKAGLAAAGLEGVGGVLVVVGVGLVVSWPVALIVAGVGLVAVSRL